LPLPVSPSDSLLTGSFPSPASSRSPDLAVDADVNKNEDGTRQEDWFEPDMDRIEERNLLRFGMEGVVDYNY
jgi:hypothetical protein